MLFGTSILPVREVRAQGLSVSVTASPSAICNGESSLLTANASGGSGSYTYSWSNGQTTGSFTDYPTVTTVYSVTVSDGSNTVTDNATVTVSGNTQCCVSGLGTIHEYPDATGLLAAIGSGSTVTTTDIILITGAFIVDVDLTFQNCPNIRANPYAEILLDPGVRLKLDNSVISAACPTMWTGIVAPNNNDGVEVQEGSVIRDAVVGIHSTNGGLVAVRQSTMRDNHVHVRLEDGDYDNTGSWGGQFAGSLFECTATGSVTNLLYPHLGEATEIGIHILNVSNAQVGHTQQYQENIFRRFRSAGIYADNVDYLQVYNNEFTGGSTSTPWAGLMSNSSGIFATSHVDAVLKVGGFGSYQKNKFYSNLIQFGIQTHDHNQIQIKNNEFSDMVQRGMNIDNPWGFVEIEQNKILAGGHPIRVLNPQFNVLIQDNEITSGTGRAIDVQNTTIDPFVRVRISVNFIGGRRFGIILTNLQEAFVNENYMDIPAAYTGTQVTGIRLNSCEDCIIQDNFITDLNTTNRANYFGIDVRDNSDHTLLCSNYITNMRRGIVYVGGNAANQVVTNTIEDARFGFTVASFGVAGPQGPCSPCPGGMGTPRGDPYGNVFINSGDWDLYAEDWSDGNDSPFAENGGLSTSEDDPSQSTRMPVIMESAASVPSCPGNPHNFRLAESTTSGAEMVLNVPEYFFTTRDRISGRINNQETGLDNYLWLYDYAISLMASRQGFNPLTVSGFSPVGNSAILAHAEADLNRALHDSTSGITPMDVLVRLANIRPSGDLEVAFHLVLTQAAGFYASNRIKESLMPEISRLRTLAASCFAHYGRAAILASNLVALATGETIDSDDCTLSDPGQRLKDPFTGNLHITGYPNPADKEFAIKIDRNEDADWYQVTLMDLHGKILHEERITDRHSTVVSTRTLPTGMYFYTVRDHTGRIGKGKIAVSR